MSCSNRRQLKEPSFRRKPESRKSPGKERAGLPRVLDSGLRRNDGFIRIIVMRLPLAPSATKPPHPPQAHGPFRRALQQLLGSGQALLKAHWAVGDADYGGDAMLV